MDELIDKMEEYYRNIHNLRIGIAELKKTKVIKKAPLWEEATGTVDNKKDYIKSKLADIEHDITVAESDIEYAYNMIDVLNWRIMNNE